MNEIGGVDRHSTGTATETKRDWPRGSRSVLGGGGANGVRGKERERGNSSPFRERWTDAAVKKRWWKLVEGGRFEGDNLRISHGSIPSFLPFPPSIYARGVSGASERPSHLMSIISHERDARFGLSLEFGHQTMSKPTPILHSSLPLFPAATFTNTR